MKFSPELIPAVLEKRYKRFLADVHSPALGEVTVHCPNTGSMKNCWKPGWQVWLVDSQNPKRKYQYTWVVAQNEQRHLIGVNTHYANLLVEEGIVSGVIEELATYKTLKREVKYGLENSRIDFLLTDESDVRTFVEVKSVTLLEDDGHGYFPDAVSTRGQKHLRELIEVAEQGDRAVLCFLIQHTGIKDVRAAQHIDPKYAELLEEAIAKGVQVIAYGVSISPKEIKVSEKRHFYL